MSSPGKDLPLCSSFLPPSCLLGRDAPVAARNFTELFAARAADGNRGRQSKVSASEPQGKYLLPLPFRYGIRTDPPCGPPLWTPTMTRVTMRLQWRPFVYSWGYTFLHPPDPPRGTFFHLFPFFIKTSVEKRKTPSKSTKFRRKSAQIR